MKILSTTVAVRDVCAWPNRTLLADGTIAAVIYYMGVVRWRPAGK